jgi:hypothetical protein
MCQRITSRSRFSRLRKNQQRHRCDLSHIASHLFFSLLGAPNTLLALIITNGSIERGHLNVIGHGGHQTFVSGTSCIQPRLGAENRFFAKRPSLPKTRCGLACLPLIAWLPLHLVLLHRLFSKAFIQDTIDRCLALHYPLFTNATEKAVEAYLLSSDPAATVVEVCPIP